MPKKIIALTLVIGALLFGASFASAEGGGTVPTSTISSIGNTDPVGPTNPPSEDECLFVLANDYNGDSAYPPGVGQTKWTLAPCSLCTGEVLESYDSDPNCPEVTTTTVEVGDPPTTTAPLVTRNTLPKTGSGTTVITFGLLGSIALAFGAVLMIMRRKFKTLP